MGVYFEDVMDLVSELLTLEEARELMLGLRRRIGALQRLDRLRHEQWRAEHPEIVAIWDQMHQLDDAGLESAMEDCEHKLTSAELSLLFQHESLSETLMPLLRALPGGGLPATLLTAAEQSELRAARSQAEKLRRRLPRELKA